MVLTNADLPSGYINVDEGYYLTEQGISSFYFRQAASREEIATLGLKSMYDTYFVANANGNLLYLYIAEFASQEAAEEGFGVFEDETRPLEGVDVLSSHDLPGPNVGQSPSETTVSLIDYVDRSGPLINQTGITFRIQAFLVGILLETHAETIIEEASPHAHATPELDPQKEQLLNDLAAILVERIETVQAGEEVSGADQGLPPLLLPTDQAWPLPGIVSEGYKDAPLVLGEDGPAADLADAFRSAYSRTVPPGQSTSNWLSQPPLVTVGVSVFDSSDAALSALEVSDDMPIPGPYPPSLHWEQVETAEIQESGETRAYRSALDPDGPINSARVAFVSGVYVVTVDVLGAVSEPAALEAAEDLAFQQALCLSSGGRCNDVSVPGALNPN